MVLTGAQIVVECLKEQGVDTVFGYPGGTILNVYDALYQHSEEIKHILTSHEQGAAHAADGYARSTGKVGVCLATSGPGATNLVTGIATAYMDSVPMVAITANVNLPLLGKDTFQEVDIAGVTMPITKHGYIVKNVEILADTIRSGQVKGLDRFIQYCVNARFFNINGTNDHVVDTLGLSLLYIEDLQYHFHDMDPNWVVGHAYSMASYILSNDCPIKNGDTIDGIADGRIVQDIQWKCCFEDSLIGPKRPVLDVCMGEYAAGERQ